MSSQPIVHNKEYENIFAFDLCPLPRPAAEGPFVYQEGLPLPP